MKRNQYFLIVVIVFVCFAFITIASCSKKDEPVVIPPSTKSLATITTSAIIEITETSATGGGNVTSDGNASVTAKGVCWNTAPSPTISDNKTTNGTGKGLFISNLTGLISNTTYYVRAYATNSEGTGYGEQKEFTSASDETYYTDTRDGHIYKIVDIGAQTWFAENLAYLPSVSSSEDVSETDSYYYVYGYEGSNVNESKETDNYKTYGVLYNWLAAMAGSTSSNKNPSGIQGACPSGWHLPSDNEWKQMEIHIGMSQSEADSEGSRGDNEGKKLKSTSGWYNNENGTDNFGFKALPGGSFSYTGFSGLTEYGMFWPSSEDNTSAAWYRLLSYNYDEVFRRKRNKAIGYSVRCIKD